MFKEIKENASPVAEIKRVFLLVCLCFPFSWLGLPGDAHGGACSWSPPVDLVIPKHLSPGLKSISQTWGPGNGQLRTFYIGSQVSLTACNRRTQVDLTGKHPAFLLTQCDPCTGQCLLNFAWPGLPPQKKPELLGPQADLLY